MVAIDDLLCVWEERQEQGEPITPEELCQHCPEMLGEVRWHIRALQAVESHFGATQSGHSRATTNAESKTGHIPSGPVHVSTEYHIERLHASGGLGHVFVATDPVLNRRVAIKFPKLQRLSNDQRARFEREARVTSRLDHPGIVPVHSLKQDDPNRPCYVMRFVEGPTLHQTILELHKKAGETRSRNFFYAIEFRHLLQNLISLNNIVAYAHGQGVIHRDIKPGNVILGTFGETLLLDWGLAKVIGESEEILTTQPPEQKDHSPLETLHGQVMGTPAFSSPEQLLGQTDRVDQRSDIYSLGVTLYFLLTGKYPIESGSLSQQIESAVRGKFAPPRAIFPSIPTALQAICQRAMATDSSARYQTVPEMTADLECFLAGDAVSVLADPLHRRIGRTLRRRPGIFAAMIATTLVAILAGWIGSALLNQKNRELVRANDRLKVAAMESQLANGQTLLALRTMVDDVVVRDLSEGVLPDPEERRFLEQVLNQYEALAGIQGNTPSSVAIRAEGLGQAGRIFLRLADESEALTKLRESASQFQRLVDETGEAGHKLQLARVKGDLSDALQRVGQLDEGVKEATDAIQLLVTGSVKNEQSEDVNVAKANLYRILAAAQQRRLEWAAADQSLAKAQTGFEELLKHKPEEKKFRQSLAAIYRMQGENSHWLGDIARQGKSLNLAVRSQRELVEQFPDQPEHELGLALALNSLSRYREFEGQITLAIDEVTEAIDLSTHLAKKFPGAARYRQTLASLHHSRGNLRRIHGQPLLADNDFREAITQWNALAKEQPDIPDYQSEGQAVQLDLAGMKLDTSRLDSGEQLLNDLILRWDGFAKKFPEIAARSMILPISKIQWVRIQRRTGYVQSDLRKLDEAIQKLQEIAKHDRSGLPEFWIASAGLEKAVVLRVLVLPAVSVAKQKLSDLERAKIGSPQEDRRKRLDASKQCVDEVAEALQKLEKTQQGNHELLGKIAGLHRQVALLYDGLEQPELANFHRQHELDLRTAIVKAFPDNPYYRVLLARAWMGQAPGSAAERNEPEALKRLAVAGEVLQAAVNHYPGDQLVLRTMGDLRTREGRVLFASKKYQEADLKFSEAVRLNPTFENRASHAHNLAWFRPEEVLEKIDGVLSDGIPDNFPLLTLLRACGVASDAQAGTPAANELAVRAERILQHMVDEKYSPTSGLLLELQTRTLYQSFREREKFSRLLAALESHRLDRQSPQFIRQLPEPFRPAARWLMEQSVLDANPAILLYRAMGGRIQ
ncbi:MAG: protein kinase [Pirellulaceae bacterium]